MLSEVILEQRIVATCDGGAEVDAVVGHVVVGCRRFEGLYLVLDCYGGQPFLDSPQ